MDIEAEVVSVEGFTDEDAVLVRENIMTLVTTPMGTCPGDRGYGIDYSLLDKPLETVCGALAMDITDKIEKYEPRAELADIDFDVDTPGGSLIIMLRIAAADSDEEEDIYTGSDYDGYEEDVETGDYADIEE